MSEENPVENKPTITLSDISAVVEVIRVVTERGVWKASELSVVGSLYDRLTKFLESTESQVKSSGEENKPTT
jgi:hypothetical protein